MTLKANRLYLIKVKFQPLAIVSANDSLKAIRKYVERTGFDNIYEYVCDYLMASTTGITTTQDTANKYYFISTCTETIGDAHLSISSQQVTNCSDIFKMIDYTDINNPLLVRPTIEEVRNCIGFSRAAMRELRKFCI